MPQPPWALSAAELRQHYLAGELSPVDVTQAILDRLDELNPTLNAFIHVTRDLALSQASLAERAFRRRESSPELLPLLGIPVSIKDNLPTRGIPTTMGSRLFENWVPHQDAAAVERLRAGGVVLLGKTNTSEFGWKGDAGNLLAGPTHNPWDLDRTSGGSSGGAAAAAAVGLGVAALGTDGAGSLRIPASFCGVVGYKPAQGTVPVYPNSGIGTLSHHGLIARSVADVAQVLELIAGPDPRDRLSAPVPWTAPIAEPSITGLRIAYSPTLGYADVEPDVRAVVGAAVCAFEEQGCHVEEIDPGLEDPHEAIWTAMLVSHATQHADDLDAVRDLIDPGRLELVEEGQQLSAIDVGRARVLRTKLYERVSALMSDYDLLLTPTMPCTAFRIGLDRPESVAGQPTREFRWTPFTYPFNLTGHPAISLPCGLTDDALPVGLQIVGPWRDDDLVLRAAATFEAARPWPSLAPLGTGSHRRTT